MVDNDFSALLKIVIDNASAKKEMDKTVKELQDKIEIEADIKVNKTDIKKALNELEKNKTKINIDTKDATAQIKKLATERQKLTTANNIKLFSDNNTKMAKNLRTELNELFSQVTSGAEMSKAELEGIKTKFSTIKLKARESGQLGKNFFGTMADGVKKFGDWAIVSGAVMTLTNNLRDAIDNLKEVDTLLTEISKTSNDTQEQLNQIGSNSYDTASKYGVKNTDYLSGVLEMNRSGFYGEEGNQMAELSVMAQSAGDMTADLANSYLLATNAAFNYQGNVEKLTAALDGQNQITNTNSVDMTTMAEATSKAGATASTTGVKINELSAMIGTISARTKEAGEITGTGIKSLLLNLQNINSSKITNTLKKANASMTETKDGIEQMRSPIEILQDLQKTFNSLDESDPLRSEILNNIGGKYRANQLAALLTGWSDYQKMLKDYSEGSGSAFEESQKSANNLEGSLNKLDNSWNELVSSFTNAESLKGIVNIFSGILNSTTGLINTLHPLPALLISISGAMSGIKDIGIFKTIKDETTGLNKTVSVLGISFSELGQRIAGIKTDGLKSLFGSNIDTKAVDEYNKQIENGVKPQEAFKNATKGTNDATKSLIKSANGATVSQEAVDGAIKSTTLSARASSIAIKGLSVACNMLAGLAIGFALQGIVSIIDDITHADENLRDSIDEDQSAFDDATSQVSDLQNQLTTCKKRMEELQGLSNSGKITTIEQEELDKLKAENKELETNLKYQKEKQVISAQKKVDDTTELANKTVTSDYKRATSGVTVSVSKAKEIEYGIDYYKRLQKETSKLNKSSSDYSDNQKEMTEVRENINGLYGDIEKAISAYEDFKKVNNGLTKDQQSELNHYKKLSSVYGKFLDYVNESSDSMDNNTDSTKQNTQANKDNADSQDENTDSTDNAEDALEKYNAQVEKAVKNSSNSIKLKYDIQDTNITDSIARYEEEAKIIQAIFKAINDGDYNSDSLKTMVESLGLSADALDGTKEGAKELENQIAELAQTNLAPLLQSIDTLHSEGIISDEQYKQLQNTLNTLCNQSIQPNSFNELSDALDKATVADENYNTILNSVNATHTITDAQLSKLLSLYPELADSVQGSANAWYFEDDAINTVDSSISGLQSAYINAQNAMSTALTTQMQQRLNNLGIELEGVTDVASAYNTLSVAQGVLKSKANAEGRSGDNEEVPEDVKQLVLAKGKTEELAKKLKGLSSKVSSRKSSGTSGSKGTNKSGNSFDKEYDNITTKAQNLQDKIDISLNKITDNSNEKTKRKADKNAIRWAKQQLKVYQKGAKYYNKQASKIKFSKSQQKIADKVVNGDISISTIKKEKLADKIDKYKDLKDKAQDCKEGVVKANKQIIESTNALAQIKIDKYEARLNRLKATSDKISDNIDLKQSKVSYGDYKKLISNSDKQIKQLKNENEEYNNQLKTLPKTSDAYNDIKDKIDDNNSSIRECQKNQLDWNKSIQELKLDKLEHLKALYESIKNLNESKIDLKNTNGQVVTGADYDNNINSDNNTIENTQSSISQAEKYLAIRRSGLSGNKLINWVKKQYGVNKSSAKSMIAEARSQSINEWKTEINNYKNDIIEAQTDIADNENSKKEIPLNNIDEQISRQEALNDTIQAGIDLKADGASQEDLQNKINGDNAEINLQNQKLAILKQIQATYDVGSSKWNEYQEQIESTQSAINGLNQSVVEAQRNLRDLQLKPIDDNNDSIQSEIEGTSAIGDLIDDNNLYNDNGSFNQNGLNKIATYMRQRQLNYNAIANAKNGLATLEQQKAQGLYDNDMETYNSKYEEYQSIITSSASAVNDLESSLQDLYKTQKENAIDAQIDALNKMKDALEKANNALQDAIDKRKDMLDSEKDYQDYQDEIAEKNKTVENIQAQIDALTAANDSLENRAELARLQDEQSEAQKDLAKTQNDHEFDVISDGLSDLSDDLNDRYDDYNDKIDDEIDALNDAKDKLDKDLTDINTVTSELGGLVKNSASSVVNSLGALLNHYGVDSSAYNLDLSNVTHFAKGGTVELGNDDGIAALKAGESVLTVDSTANLVSAMKIAQNLIDSINSTSYSNLQSVTQQQPQSSISLSFDNLINVEGNVDKSFSDEFNSMVQNASQQVQDTLYQSLKNAGFNITK